MSEMVAIIVVCAVVLGLEWVATQMALTKFNHQIERRQISKDQRRRPEFGQQMHISFPIALIVLIAIS